MQPLVDTVAPYLRYIREIPVPDFRPHDSDQGHVMAIWKIVFRIDRPEDRALYHNFWNNKFIITLEFVRPSEASRYGWRLMKIQECLILDSTGEAVQGREVAQGDIHEFFKMVIIDTNGSIERSIFRVR